MFNYNLFFTVYKSILLLGCVVFAVTEMSKMQPLRYKLDYVFFFKSKPKS